MVDDNKVVDEKKIADDKEILEAFNKSKSSKEGQQEQELFIKLLHKAAAEMEAKIIKCMPEDLPQFVKDSSHNLYPEDLGNLELETDKDVINSEESLFDNIYKVGFSDGSSFYLMKSSVCSRFVSDNWTKESIDKAAEMASKLGGNFNMIPSGQPGAFPDHLREYAAQAWGKYGMDLKDPTPPTPEMIENSRQKSEPAFLSSISDSKSTDTAINNIKDLSSSLDKENTAASEVSEQKQQDSSIDASPTI